MRTINSSTVFSDSPITVLTGTVNKSRSLGFRLLLFAIFIFLLLSIFDPADKLFGLKMPIFIFCMLYGFMLRLLRREAFLIPVGLLIYTSLMVLIPLISLAVYYFSDGHEPFEGFQMAKAYFFVSFAILLYSLEINITKQLSVVLTALSMAILVVFFVLMFVPSLLPIIYVVGVDYGIFYLDNRKYGSDLTLSQTYFATSPMLVIPIAHYFYQAKFSANKKVRNVVLLVLNIVAMFVAGSRNNMMAALLLPLTLYLVFAKKKMKSLLVLLILSSCFLFGFYGDLVTLLDPSEQSNSLKLGLLNDYLDIFGNPFDLLFGQGLGSYYQWTARGTYYYVTELTYLEIIRNFGLLFGMVVVFLLVYPIVYAFVLNKGYGERHIVLAYAFYLLMCFTNPNLFSSMGMLILASVLANIFIFRKQTLKARIAN